VPPAADATLWVGDGLVSDPAQLRERLTGVDMPSNLRWQVAGTDLGIPYVLENGSIGYLFGDTFNTAYPEGPPLPNDWRSPVMLRSAVQPSDPGGIAFDSAAQVTGDGPAPEIFHNGHTGVGIDGISEVTVIPNDAVSFPEIGRQIVSYMSVGSWDPVNGAAWTTNYAGLAYSDNGNDFVRTELMWPNDAQNSDPFQMWTMQRSGDYVYVFSVRGGRQMGPMMLRRVLWDQMLTPTAYEGWGYDGATWDWNRPCTPIMTGVFGEPSVRLLGDGTWAMSYLNCTAGAIVSRTATDPWGPWSGEKVQVVCGDGSGLYGGFIHPWSSTKADDLHLMVSKWAREDGHSTAYNVAHYVGTL
jgi:hypothetical protein